MKATSTIHARPNVILWYNKNAFKECQSIVRGESVYLTMLSGHSRYTHSVSVPNISVLLHTHVEAVLKFEVVSHFVHSEAISQPIFTYDPPN